MQKLSRCGPSGAVMAVLVLSLGACEKHQEAPPVAALPPPSPQLPAPIPSADDLLQGQFAQFGAKPGDGGWTVTLSSAKFKAGKVSFAPDDEATIGKIAELLNANLQLRILIEDYADEHGSRTHTQRLSQEHANAVLRDLTSMGVDPGKVQAQGRFDDSKNPRVEFIFSNAGGEFRPAPVENS